MMSPNNSRERVDLARSVADGILWLPVPGYEKRYEVSSDGRIRNRRGLILKQICNMHGYFVVTLSGALKGNTKRVHRIVAKAFIPNPLGLPDVNHINCDKSDNRVENLEWCTAQQNNIHAARNGKAGGKRYGYAILTDEVIAEIERLRFQAQMSTRAIARHLNVSKSSVHRLCLLKERAA